MTEIILKGNGIIIGSIADEEDSGDLYEFGMLLDTIQLLADGEDVMKKKGRYVKDKNWIKTHYAVSDEFPRYFRVINDIFELSARFVIDDDNFDPAKLQLIKSDYELQRLPYGIVFDTILYDGKEIKPADEDEFWENFDYGMEGYDIIEVDHMPY